MADLSTLNPLLPASGDLVSEGDDRIRETRDSIVNSFGVEHDLTGAHSFFSGDDGVRPAAGIPDRIFLNTALQFLERDTGSAWEQLHAAGVYFLTGDSTGGIDNSPAWTTPLGDLAIYVRPNSHVVIFTCQLFLVGPGIQVQSRVLADGVEHVVTPQGYVKNSGTLATLMLNGLWGYSPTVSGAHTISYQVNVVGGSGGDAAGLSSQLVALVL